LYKKSILYGIYNRLPEKEPMRFETCRRRQKLDNWWCR